MEFAAVVAAVVQAPPPALGAGRLWGRHRVRRFHVSPCCTPPHRSALHRTLRHCTALHRTALLYAAMHNTGLFFSVLDCSARELIAQHCFPLSLFAVGTLSLSIKVGSRFLHPASRRVSGANFPPYHPSRGILVFLLQNMSLHQPFVQNLSLKKENSWIIHEASTQAKPQVSPRSRHQVRVIAAAWPCRTAHRMALEHHIHRKKQRT